MDTSQKYPPRFRSPRFGTQRRYAGRNKIGIYKIHCGYSRQEFHGKCCFARSVRTCNNVDRWSLIHDSIVNPIEQIPDGTFTVRMNIAAHFPNSQLKGVFLLNLTTDSRLTFRLCRQMAMLLWAAKDHLMNIVIIGPGAMGCLFAGLLTGGGHKVCLLDKRADRAERISRQGLKIEGPAGTRVIPIRATARAASLKGAELILICVKAYDTASTAPEILALLSSRSLVLTLQNGLGNVEHLAEHVPPGQILAGVTAHGSTLLSAGHIRHAGAGPTTLTALQPEQQNQAALLAEVFTRAGIAASTAPDLAGMLWSKLIVNAAIGPVSALAGLANGQLLEQAAWRELLRQAAAEGAAVAARKSIRLAFADPREAVEKVCRDTATNASSMLQDVRRGRRTEIDAINGAIVREAEQLGMAAPVHTDLVRRVRALGGKPL